MALTTLQWPDYLILAAFLVISLGIGFYHSVTGGRQRTTQEFIMANRKLGILPTAMSLFVSYQSAIMILGCTAEMYLFGIQFLIWGCVSFTVAILLTARLMIPWLYPLKLVSVNDYLEQRFESRAVRIFGSVIGICGGIIYMGVAMYAPSAALESATGLPVKVSIPLMAVVSVAYTSMGGMRAVIWTDVFQFAMLMGGLLAILIKGLIVVGGVQNVFDICYQDGRLEAANWSVNPTERHTVWGFTIGFSVGWAMLYSVGQASVQRYSATENIRKAGITLLINIPALMVLYVVVCSTGLIVYAYYSSIQCDPLANKDITNSNQLLSLFVTTIFSDAPGFSGLFLSTLYGGALSSVSSSLSGAAANCWDDILKLKLDGMSEQRKALVNRMLVVVFGFIATGIALLASTIPGPIIQVSNLFGSSVAGPIYGVYLLAGLSRYANAKGALVGGISSVCVMVWLNVGSFNLHRPLPTLPPASTAGCAALLFSSNETWSNATSAWTTSWTDETYDSVTSSLYVDNDNSSVAVFSTDQPLIGIQNFYALSYTWYSLFGILTTYSIGIIVSLIFRDRAAEARVPDRLLISFNRFFTCSDMDSKTVNDDQGNGLVKIDVNKQEECDSTVVDTEVKVNSDIYYDKQNEHSNASESLLTHRA